MPWRLTLRSLGIEPGSGGPKKSGCSKFLIPHANAVEYGMHRSIELIRVVFDGMLERVDSELPTSLKKGNVRAINTGGPPKIFHLGKSNRIVSLRERERAKRERSEAKRENE